MKLIWGTLKYLVIVMVLLAFFVLFFWGTDYVFPRVEFYTPQMRIELVEEKSDDVQYWSYPHNENKKKGLQVWEMVYLDAGAYFESSISYQQINILHENKISIVEESSDRSSMEGFLVGYGFEGAVLYYLKNETLLQEELVDIDSPVLGGNWLETQVLVLAMNDEYTLNAYWYAYQDEDWVLSSFIKTDIRPKEYVQTIPLLGTGIFALAGDDVYLFSLNQIEYRKVLSDVELYNVLGSDAFYIMHYRDAKGSVFDAMVEGENIVTWREKELLKSDEFLIGEDVIELYKVSEREKKFYLKQGKEFYEISLP